MKIINMRSTERALDYNLNKLGQVPLGDATYRIPKLSIYRHSGFKREDFLGFPNVSLHVFETGVPRVGPLFAPETKL